MEKTDMAEACRGIAGRPRCPGKGADILEAALSLLADQGFTRMTLDAVARAAGVSKATIHLRFRTKAELAAAALKTLRPCPALPVTGDLCTDLAAVLDDFAGTLVHTRGMALTGTCLAEEDHTPELLELLREYAVLPRRRSVLRLLDAARSQGRLAPDADLEALTSALLGACYADHLAGRAITGDWAERTVASVLSAPGRC